MTLMTHLKNFASFITLFLILASSLYAADLIREKRLADEIVDTIIDGEVVFLQSQGHAFLSIYTEADKAKGVAIILHGRGFHPDWQDAINPLRVGLVEAGWSTLSVQMPVLEKQAKYYDYVPLFDEAIPRIDAAILYAREVTGDRPENKVILIAHSCGAHMAMAWLDFEGADAAQKIDAYVGIGMGATDYKQPMKRSFPLDKLTLPVLDVYADHDYPAVMKMATERLAMIEAAGNKKSKQVIVSDSDHYYAARGKELTRVISQWLQSL